MSSPVDVANEALLSIGAQAQISAISPSDGSPEGDAISLLYSPKLRALLRSAHWEFARKTVALTQLKTAVGATSSTPASQLPAPPFLYEYAYPSDALYARFLLPSVQNALPNPPLTTGNSFPMNLYFGPYPKFVIASDVDSTGAPIKVVLTNAFQATLVYTADLTQTPDQWDAGFHEAAVATLAAFLVNPLARNNALLQSTIQIATGIIANERARNANEGSPSINRDASWIVARGSGYNWGEGGSGNDFMDGYYNSWVTMGFPGGLSF